MTLPEKIRMLCSFLIFQLQKKIYTYICSSVKQIWIGLELEWVVKKNEPTKGNWTDISTSFCLFTYGHHFFFFNTCTDRFDEVGVFTPFRFFISLSKLFESQLWIPLMFIWNGVKFVRTCFLPSESITVRTRNIL